MGESQIAWVANEGARVSRIVKHVEGQAFSGRARPLRDQLFELSAPAIANAPPVPQRAETGSVTALPQPDASGDAVWTVPVQIAMRVGAPISAVPAAGTDSPAAAFAAAPAPPPDEDPELIATLRELEDSGDGPTTSSRG